MEKKSKGFAITTAIVAFIGISLLATVAVLNRRDQIVGLNKEIQYDDFAFSVLDFRTADAVGRDESQAKARGVYYVATLNIANHAVRVDYTFKKASPILVDRTGHEYHVAIDAQAALDATQSEPCSRALPAGASCTTDVVFDVPAGTQIKQLRISEGGLVGDILDVVFFGKKRIELESSK